MHNGSIRLMPCTYVSSCDFLFGLCVYEATSNVSVYCSCLSWRVCWMCGLQMWWTGRACCVGYSHLSSRRSVGYVLTSMLRVYYWSCSMPRPLISVSQVISTAEKLSLAPAQAVSITMLLLHLMLALLLGKLSRIPWIEKHPSALSQVILVLLFRFEHIDSLQLIFSVCVKSACSNQNPRAATTRAAAQRSSSRVSEESWRRESNPAAVAFKQTSEGSSQASNPEDARSRSATEDWVLWEMHVSYAWWMPMHFEMHRENGRWNLLEDTWLCCVEYLLQNSSQAQISENVRFWLVDNRLLSSKKINYRDWNNLKCN